VQRTQLQQRPRAQRFSGLHRPTRPFKSLASRVVAASFADPPVAAALRVILLGNARLGQADEFGKRRIRPALQRRGKGCHGGAAVPVERPQVNVASGAGG
jgi:hypothetical protein